MTWPEIQNRLTKTDIALLPVGQTEQHSTHLPIDVDNIISTGLAKRVAIETYDTAMPVVAPAIPFGYSNIPFFRDYPGVFSLSPDTLVGVYEDVALSLIRMGFKKIIFINGHAPNPPFIQEAMRRVTKETNAFLAMCNFFQIPNKEVATILEEMDRPPVWGHACLIETSVSHVFGAEVRDGDIREATLGDVPEELKNFVPASPEGITLPSFEYEETARVYWPENGSGSKGNPEGYSKEIGERVIRATTSPIIELVDSIKDMKVALKDFSK
ncbi:MAG: creatininase family protein [Firmicutes bacterium]|nr:creatininase family protein [Peptoniphilus sp.]MDD7363710.1 creatininase family protein [Bacillota bacterium]